MAEAKGRLGVLRIARRVAGDELERPLSLHRQDGAVIPARKWMREAAGLRGVEQENVVGIGEEGFVPSRTAEQPSADENDAVRRVRFLVAFGLDMRAASEIHHGHAEGLEEHAALGALRLGWKR